MVNRSDQPPTVDRSAPTDWRRTWLTPRAIAMHVTLLVVVPTFAGLFWWQVQRVRQGNTLSWAYVFEWPFFAAYAVYMWWKLVHDYAADTGADVGADTGADAPAASTVDDRSNATTSAATAPGTTAPGARTLGASVPAEPAAPPATEPVEPPRRPPASRQDEDDEEMAAYNRYLAELDASGRRKQW